MNMDTVYQQLNEMRLSRMAQQLRDKLSNSDYRDLSHEEFIAFLVEDEYLNRKQRRLFRMVSRAGFKPEQPAIEDIIYSETRGFSKKDALQFGTPKWITESRNIIFIGPTGCGKSFISQAIALQAFLFEEINAARGTGQYLKFLKTMATTKVLILDDFLMQETSVQDLSPLMDIIEEKQQTGSIIITTPYPIQKWQHRMPDPTMADAICDRLVSTAYKFNMKGDQSMRRKAVKSQVK